jgi:tetratricopeptide (TPR) repeat protein
MSEIQQPENHPFLTFVNKNQKVLIYLLVSIILVIGSYFGYMELYKNPREAKAADAMYTAEKYFAQDSANLVLNGDGINKGVLYIIKEFSGTNAANLANYYAGISYFKLGDFKKSITYLKDFSTSAKQVQAIAYGTMGDAYAELKNNEEAINTYKKAGTHFPEDEGISAEYLFRAALLAETIGKTEEALTLYKEIKTKYPKTEKGFTIDKYIYRLQVQP